MAPTLFISYRRSDSAGFARALYDYLRRHIPPERLFIDVDAMAPGASFAHEAEQRVAQADVFLLLIGPTWLHVTDERGRRLDNPDDLVRREIETALQSGVRVVPVLIDGTPMPTEDELPSSIQALPRYNAVSISHASFEAQAARLLPLLAPAPAPLRGVLFGTLGIFGALALLWAVGTLPVTLEVAAAAALGGLVVGVALTLALRAFQPSVRSQRLHRMLGTGLAVLLISLVGWRAVQYTTAPFDLTVHLDAPLEAALAGEVALRYDQTERRAPVMGKGDVVFTGIPGRYRGALVVTPHIEGFLRQADTVATATGVHTLHLAPETHQTQVRGTVVDPAGRPLPGVLLDFDSGLATAATDSLGRFAVAVPRAAGSAVMVRATRAGTTGYYDLVTLAALPLRIPFDAP